jgi:hypothetical protein
MATKRGNIVANGCLSLNFFVTILFIVLRLTHVINWSWWWVFCPLWGPVAVVIAMMIIVFIASMIY